MSTSLSNVTGVAGGGVEWAYNNNVTVRIEALDYFGTTTFGLGGDLGNKVADIWVVRVGGSFRY